MPSGSVDSLMQAICCVPCRYDLCVMTCIWAFLDVFAAGASAQRSAKTSFLLCGPPGPARQTPSALLVPASHPVLCTRTSCIDRQSSGSGSKAKGLGEGPRPAFARTGIFIVEISGNLAYGWCASSARTSRSDIHGR